MSVEQRYRVIVETDQDGQFIKLPDGWLIDPENSDLLVEHEVGQDSYIARPVIRYDGLPNCRFIFPTNELG